MTDWISVGKEMPQVGKAYLVCVSGRHAFSAFYMQWKGAKTEKGRAPRFEDCRGIVHGVTHWAKLPEPPKGEE